MSIDISPYLFSQFKAWNTKTRKQSWPLSCLTSACSLTSSTDSFKYTQHQHSLGIKDMVLKSLSWWKYLTAPPMSSSATMGKSLNSPELHSLFCIMEMIIIPTNAGTYIHKTLCLEQNKQSKCISNNDYFYSLWFPWNCMWLIYSRYSRNICWSWLNQQRNE